MPTSEIYTLSLHDALPISNGDPSNWLCNRATNFKKYITDSNIKVATGGIGGDQVHGYNLLSKALTCSAIDIISIHAYVGDASDRKSTRLNSSHSSISYAVF